MKNSLLSITLLFAITVGVSTGTGVDYLSPVDLDSFDGGKKLLITHHTGARLDVFDTVNDTVTWSIELPERPSGAVSAPDAGTFYVTAGLGKGLVFAIDAVSGKIIERIPAGHSPVSPVLSKDGKALYVCDRFNNAVGVIDLEKRKWVKTIPVGREPVAAGMSPDGKFLFVANHLPGGRSDLEYVAANVSVIDTTKNEVVNTVKLVNGSESLRAVCFSPDGERAYVTHLIARFMVPTTQIERGWINTSAISVIRVSDQKRLYTLLLDDIDMGFANPWAMMASEDGKFLCVSSAGNNEIRIIDLPAMTKKAEAGMVAKKDGAEADDLDLHNDLSFMSAVSKRIQLTGVGPRDLAIIGDRIYLCEYFSDSLGKVSLAGDLSVSAVASVALGPKVPLTPERQGAIFFNDAALCFQKWQSCASCHSDDGRVDGLNWDLMNDGMGNPKNAKSLFLSHVTPPVMALGVRDKAETAVRAGIRYIQFAVRPDADAEAIDAYLKGLEQVPSPYLEDGLFSNAAKRGKELFSSAGCIACHPAPLFTNLKSYDVGTGKGQDAGKKIDVPTLREVWRTSPYMHDGRAVTIFEVIKRHNPDEKRGKTSALTDNQINDLAEYVNSL